MASRLIAHAIAATPSPRRHRRVVPRRWLKITSVYSVVATGRHALFQDADVVWLRDPIEYFFTTADDQVDCFFMDDGARSARYTPLYTNSGFYFIRNNMRTQFFMHRMLMAYDTVLAVRSHQHALICVEIKIVYGAVDLDAIDATPARRRGGAGSSPLDRISTAASSLRNDLVKCTRLTGRCPRRR
jgi:hypothetical protein